MNTRYNRIFKGFSLGIALWFIFLSASVHVLHKHSNVPCGRTGAAGQLYNPLGSTLPGAFLSQSDDPENDNPATGVNGLCPVCLFLAKNLAERLSMPPGPDSTDDESGFAICATPVLVFSLDRLTSGPRAPPGNASN